MKHSITLTLLLILFCSNFAFGQNQTLSKHEFSFYIDDLKTSTANAEILIIVSGDTIPGHKKDDLYYFPLIDTLKSFDIVVKVAGITFWGLDIKPWVLNRGTRIILGKVTELNKLQPVEFDSKRFFVLNHFTTIDIDNRDKINELQFLLIYPNNSNVHMCIQKTIK